MDSIFGLLGLSLGSLGFIFGMTAYTQIAPLKKELEDLKQKLEEMSSERRV